MGKTITDTVDALKRGQALIRDDIIGVELDDFFNNNFFVDYIKEHGENYETINCEINPLKTWFMQALQRVHAHGVRYGRELEKIIRYKDSER